MKFLILGIQQIAIGAADKAKLNRLWVDLLGITVVDSYRSENENINEDICSFGVNDLAVEIDLMEPKVLENDVKKLITAL